MFKSLFAGALATLIAGAAMAADLPRRSAAPYAASPVYSKGFSWTGVYAGLNAGYNFGDTTNSAKGAIGSVNGGSLGGTVGYNYQVQQQFVVGVEGDLAAANVSGSTGINSAKVKSIGTLRARAGYAADRALVYATAGYAGGQTKVSTATGTGSKWENGFAAGAGIEYAFTDNISAKAEYLYTDLQPKNYTLGAVDSAGVKINSVRTGVNYKF
jgi:outer membrane immunogenic protein